MANLLNIEQVAKATGLTRGTVYVYVCEGKLPPATKKVGTRCYFDRRELSAYMAVHAESGARPNARKSVRLARRGRKRRA